MKEFDECLRAKEPGMRERAYAWKTAIGLQKVDRLTPDLSRRPSLTARGRRHNVTD